MAWGTDGYSSLPAQFFNATLDLSPRRRGESVPYLPVHCYRTRMSDIQTCPARYSTYIQ